MPDSTILRLILNEFTSRGWLRAKSRTPYTLDSTATNFSLDLHQTDDSFITGFAPDEEVYRYSDDPSASFVLDGFPRTVSQAGLVDDLIPINLVVNIKTPTSIILDRIANRWVHEPSGRVYNTTFNAPKIAHIDDVTGDPLTRRTDDGLETWKIRLLNFEKTSTPLLEHYEKQGILWTVEGKSSDEITPQLLAEMDRRFGRV